jgi:twitching motility protein PilT
MTPEAEIFRRIILHNKLLPEEDVDFFLEVAADPDDAIKRMVANAMLTPEIAARLRQFYHQKVEQVLAEKARQRTSASGVSAGGQTMPPPAAAAQAGVQEADELEEVTELEEVPASGGPAAATSAPPTSVEAAAPGHATEFVAPGQKVHIDADGTYSDAPAEAVIAEPTDDGRFVTPRDPAKGADDVGLKVVIEGVRLGASDVHLTSGSPPFYRLHGAMVYTDLPPLTSGKAQQIALGFMNQQQQQHYLKTHDLDFSYTLENIGRFRVNALDEIRGPGIIFRIIPSRVPSLDSLGLPTSLGRFTEYHQGLVLVTGPAGCGKTTTAAALIDLVNSHRHDHIITVEDPVEFIHESKGCNVTHRQVPIHTLSFSTALKAALREDPDVIMIGEMRDLETMSLAIRAAETGHLVIGTLQTKSAMRTIDRVIDVFPEDQQAQIRAMLSESLRGVIAQQLIPRKDGRGRVVALEVLFVTNAVSNLIRDAKTFQLPSIMQTGRKQGQRLMDDSLQELVDKDIITKADAIKVADNPKRFK